MPPALRIHYHPRSLQTLSEAALDELKQSNAVPLFANNGIDWWLGQRTASGVQRPFNKGVIASQVRMQADH